MGWGSARNLFSHVRGGGVVLVVHPPRARRLDQVHVGQAPTVVLTELLHHVRFKHDRFKAVLEHQMYMRVSAL